MLQAVIFDMDGVIVDSHSVHKQAWRGLLESLGKSVTEDELDFVVEGRTRIDIVRHFLGDLPPAQLEAYGQQKDSLFLTFAERLCLLPGLLDFITELRSAGMKLAVATSASRTRTDSILNRFALGRHFHAVVTVDDVKKGKPDPEVFQSACREVHGLPSTTLVIDDAVSGVRGAKLAGMKCLGIGGPSRSQLLYAAGADWVRPDFTRVDLSMLKGWFALANQTAAESVPLP
jgi:beta-phosphoglucomutase